MTLPILLVFAHWFGDFVCQSNRMALKKSEELGALVAHVVTYTAVMGVFLYAYFLYVLWSMGVPQELTIFVLRGSTGYILSFMFLVFGTHLITDYVTSRTGRALWFMTPADASAPETSPYYYRKGMRYWFFQNIGVDQLIHYVTLAYAFQLVFGR